MVLAPNRHGLIRPGEQNGGVLIGLPHPARAQAFGDRVTDIRIDPVALVIRKNQAKGRAISVSIASIRSIRRCAETPSSASSRSAGILRGRGINLISRRPRSSRSWMSKARCAKMQSAAALDRSQATRKRHEIEPVGIGVEKRDVARAIWPDLTDDTVFLLGPLRLAQFAFD
ncbi:hypothetical protein [Mesorhizobium tamadayense]|uniref:hypothetical protein n=1 Tax=Mesorhizobium tamadayense TaxID=425306 RepID=UPI00142E2518|nr:hypothetical protein [Mesorhizobium tamadayense]